MEEENKTELKNNKLEEEPVKINTGESKPTANYADFLDFIMNIPGIEELTKSISNTIDSLSKNSSKVTEYQFRLAKYGLFFGIFVLAAIGFFGYFHLISRGVTGSLLGALIGYWYGQQKQNKK